MSKKAAKNDKPTGNLTPPKITPLTKYGRHFAVRETLIEDKNQLTGEVLGYSVERRVIPLLAENGAFYMLKVASNNNYSCDKKNGEYVGADVRSVVCGANRTIAQAERNGWDDCEFIADFNQLVAAERKAVEEGMKSNLSAGVIGYDELDLYFDVGREVYFRSSKIGGIIESVNHVNSFFGTYLQVSIKVLSACRNGVTIKLKKAKIPYFSGVIGVKNLPVVLATPEIKTSLSERGRIFSDVTSKSSYMSYTGTVRRQQGWYGTAEFKGDGRCVIDYSMMNKMDPDYFKNSYNNDDDDDEISDHVGGRGVPEDKLWMCDSVVYGFSMALKKWVEFDVGNLRPVEFREKAFEQLVMDPTKKKTILALVENNGGSFADIVEGKGGGCIFLLHGPPGTGKTLTAEAIAEVLKRPLYSISVGELGTDPVTLEASLRKILDVSSAWNAVILLDEADIFLEARDEENIVRNAMVGVFLRLLEYHQGVMFLTTNRVRRFDKAFHSRISVAVNYPGMDDGVRKQIWANLLNSAGIGGLDTNVLASHDINGRQIKNVIRLAQTLARAEGRDICEDDIASMVKVANDFSTDLSNGEDPI